jgi:hypothetical protein
MDSLPAKRLFVFYNSEGVRVVFMANQIGQRAARSRVLVDKILGVE